MTPRTTSRSDVEDTHRRLGRRTSSLVRAGLLGCLASPVAEAQAPPLLEAGPVARVLVAPGRLSMTRAVGLGGTIAAHLGERFQIEYDLAAGRATAMNTDRVDTRVKYLTQTALVTMDTRVSRRWGWEVGAGVAYESYSWHGWGPRGGVGGAGRLAISAAAGEMLHLKLGAIGMGLQQRARPTTSARTHWYTGAELAASVRLRVLACQCDW